MKTYSLMLAVALSGSLFGSGCTKPSSLCLGENVTLEVCIDNWTLGRGYFIDVGSDSPAGSFAPVNEDGSFSIALPTDDLSVR